MKILYVRFNNLNSLVGEWSIDFTDPEYLANGIFAITGPTGSGKSTILDAVCLALYGETPRLGKITKSTNEIMARQTGECFSEVEFETARGRFRCHFSQRRAYGRASGELQNQKHEIVDVHSGKPLETKVREVVALVTEVTGMDFDRFTRSILLAQGGFSRFLLAKAGERAPILEKITGTEIYGRISMKVHEQTSDQRKKLDVLQAELGAMQLFTDEEREAKETDLKGKLSLADSLTKEIKALTNYILWLERISSLEQEISTLANVADDFFKRKEASGPDLQRLALAEKAINLDADHVKVVSIRTLQKKECDALGEKKKILHLLKEEFNKAVLKQQAQEGKVRKVEEINQKEIEVIVKVRALDTLCSESHRSMKDLVAELREVEEKRSGLQKNSIDIRAKLKLSRMELEARDLYLEQHKGDEVLVESLEGIRHQIQNAVELDLKIVSMGKVLNKTRQSIHFLTVELEKNNAVCKTGQQKIDTLKNSLELTCRNIKELLGGQKLSDLRRENEVLEQRYRDLSTLSATLEKIEKGGQDLYTLENKITACQKSKIDFETEQKTLTETLKDKQRIVDYLQEKRHLIHQISSLEEQRLRLEDEKPCPLCGALEHPYAKGNVPQFDNVEQELKNAQKVFVQIQEKRSHCSLNQALKVKDIEQLTREIEQLRTLLAKEKKSCIVLFEKMEVTSSQEEPAEAVRTALSITNERLAQGKAGLSMVEDKIVLEQNCLKELAAAKDTLVENSKVRDMVKQKYEFQLNEQQRLTIEHETMSCDLEKKGAEMAERLEPFLKERFSLSKANQVLAVLTGRREEWKKNKVGKETLERKIADQVNERKTVAAILEKLTAESVNGRRKLRSAAVGLHLQVRKRRSLYGLKDPALEEKRLTSDLKIAEKSLDEIKNLVNKFDKQQHGIKVEIDSLEKSIRKRVDEIRHCEEYWTANLQHAGFRDESDYLFNRLEKKEIDQLVVLRDTLLKEEIELAVQKNDRTEKLNAEKEKRMTDRPCEELQEAKNSREEHLEEIQQLIGGLKAGLERDQKNRKQQQDKIQDLAAQKKECDRWERLHVLIGSNDGKKFRMYAQGLTFEMMIAHANRKLLEMSDRYILIRDAEQPLELGVIDNYQAGVIRSTKNLSGGESFIVSLALALGLSSMASRNVRVDSLFLDEGFGSLDEDALETALETLSGLHQDGKLIGVISHVPALKERILTRIQVVPGTGGRSRLIGPGCLEH